MDELAKFLKSMPPTARSSFAGRCGTSIGYLRKAIARGQRLGINLVIAIERNSDGAVSCEQMRPDIDWDYLRNRWRKAS